MNNSHRPQDCTAFNKRVLAKLAWALEALQGDFALILARCNYADLRDHLIQWLQEVDSIQIRVIALEDSIKTLYTIIRDELGEEQPAALMVSGLELVRDLDRVLTSMNQVREEFRKNFPFPLVLWVNDEVLEKLIRLAPDFENWATITEFAIPTDILLATIEKKADRLFTQILEYGAERFVPNDLILGSEHRQEIRAALRDLRDCKEDLTPELQASLDFVRGRDAYARKEIDAALDLYYRSLYFWQQTQNLERQGTVLFYIGLAYCLQAEQSGTEKCYCWEEARRYLQQCLDVFAGAQRQDLVAKFIAQLGEVLQNQNAWDDLQVLAHKSLALHETYPGFVQLAQDYGFLAAVALEQSHWTEADQAAQTALDIIAQVPEAQQRHKSFYLLLLARSQQQLGQYTEAIANLATARKIGVRDRPQLFLRILKILQTLYCKQKNYLEAFRVKQEQRSVEQQYGFRAFVGAGRIKAQRQARSAVAQADCQAMVAQEIAASGRQKDVKRLIERIGSTQHKLTVLYGQSGVGKSSMVDAGLIPALKEKPIGTRDVLPVRQRVYTHWIEELGNCLATALADVAGSQELIPQCNSLEGILEQLRKNEHRNLLTVLIFDQFEEFFFVGKNRADQERFAEFFHNCLTIPFVKIILSLREDYLHYLLRCSRKVNLDVINNNILDKEILYYVGNFSPEDAKSIILSLTQRSQFYLEPELVDALVQDLAHELGEVRPIELQVVGAQLQTETITTLAQYREHGPKEQLVQRYLEEVVKDCGIENQQTAELVLYLLTDENNTRPLKTRAELEGDLKALGTDLATEINNLDLLLSIFVESGLVFLLPEIPNNRYQLVHDYLVTFIRQQQGQKLIIELEKERELRSLTKEELRQTLRRLKKSLSHEKREHRRAEIAEIEALNLLSQSLFLSHEQLGALLASIKASKRVQVTEPPLDIELRTINQLRQAVYGAIEINRFQSHMAWVSSVSFSPDGHRLASSSADNTVKLWSRDGRELQTFAGHSNWVWSVSFSPDGQMLASASEDGTVRLWGLDGRELQTFTGHGAWVGSVSFSPDGQQLASSSGDGTIKLWGLDGRELQTFTGHGAWVGSVSFSPDGQQLASSSGDGTIKLWSLDGRELQTFAGHGAAVTSVSFNPDGQRLASSSGDGTIKLWSLDGQELQTFADHSSAVSSVSFSPDGQKLASSSDDGTVKLWSLDGRELQTFSCHCVWSGSVSFSPDGQRLASGSWDGTIKLWRLDGQELQTQTFSCHSAWVGSVSFSPDGQKLASGSGDCTIKLWSLDGQELQTFTGHGAWVGSVSFSPDGQKLASGSGDGTVKLWSLDGQELQTFAGHGAWVRSISFSPDGQKLASGSGDYTVKLWSLDGRELQTFAGHGAAVTSVSFSPDGQQFASGSSDGTIKLWSLNGRELQTFSGHCAWVGSVSFSPDGQRLASGSGDGTIKLWSLDGRELQTFSGHQAAVSSVSFSPDGQRLASSGGDGTIKLWSLDGRELQTFSGHPTWVWSVHFSPDGRRLASSNADGTVILRNLDLNLLDLDLDELLVRACHWLRDYLATNPYVEESDRHLCDNIQG